jgi:RND family efflux transporter MFP subunit
VAIVVAVGAEKKPVPAQPVAEPARAPFKSYIGGAGIVEASTDNISIGTSTAGVVKCVYVKVGDRVKEGQPLFEIDDRELQAELLLKKASLVKARASIEEYKAALKDYESQYALVKGSTDGRAVSIDDVQKRRDAVLLARAKVESAKAAVAYAESDIHSTWSSIDRLAVRAPSDGEVLQVNVRPGEYAATGVLDTPLMRMGNLDKLHIRVDIDENDAWRFKTGARSVAYLRGNREALEAFVASELPRVKMTHVEATYLAWLDVSELGLPDPAAACRSAGVALSAGAAFGDPAYLRLNFGCPRATLDEALRRLAPVLR